ncbi:hypothetical protein OXB_3290 [Bacillus sp. OxB-1]|uniref:hypothetical protein n=1 Tax=Bacillus sp. (strain OxB-1) TaxID=98228 RepID=UPI000581C9D4|nr:hypothetical protein [Bacillus sp. OxB-1]BAQ11759.1 hypothetical protein OXB_3290 [Bacillus sp. OxB-1]
MKKSFGLFIILFTLLLASCGGGSTASSFVVIEKGQSNNNKEYWIKGYNPSMPNKEETFKIMIKEKMVWNLIEEEVDYFVTYSNKGNNPRVLENIQR